MLLFNNFKEFTNDDEKVLNSISTIKLTEDEFM